MIKNTRVTSVADESFLTGAAFVQFQGVVSHAAVGKKTCSKQKLRELREHPGVLTITVPETPVRPAFDTTVKRPVNERDDLVVPFDAEVIDGIVAFIQFARWDLGCRL